MGLLSGSASITRFNIISRPEEPDFEQVRFTEIPPGSELRESTGFVPIEPEAPYQAGQSRFLFRVRIDKLRPDPTAVKERLKELIKSEMEMTSLPFVGPKKRKHLRELAEEELIVRAVPRSKIIEGCLDGDVLYVASTAKSLLGTVAALLRQIGVVVEPKAPWIDNDEAELESELLTTREPGESVLGCRFLRALVGDREVLFEPESGLVRLQTGEARITLSGGVLGDLLKYIERGAEVLSAKLVLGESSFRFDGLSFRINALRIETDRHEHWTELLDERLEKIAAVFEVLDTKYTELGSDLRAAQPVVAPAKVLSFRDS